MSDITFNNVSYFTECENGARKEILSRINFFVDNGKILLVMGPSGSGKTTILKLINRMIQASEGSILIGGIDINTLEPRELRKRVGIVFQKHIFPLATVYENLLIPSKFSNNIKATREDFIRFLLKVGLCPENLNSKITELSYGQLARISLVRTLIADPEILMIDEPTANLDPESASKILELIMEINQRDKKTILFVTNNPVHANILGSNCIILTNGKIIDCGKTSDFLNK